MSPEGTAAAAAPVTPALAPVVVVVVASTDWPDRTVCLLCRWISTL